ncbi:E3 ubiquitin-protein ligase APD2-like isoform X2 [Malus sylvestris]|uniref:E3 ubiquitin-protein ligase APD2-like isoform X2 n=1 Tax=Malus sylvestris TaxID=3752 RepID=UPI0021AB9D1C|nr:E3 ubiquitin-protein ligase APD2-like isoform X2 [Malus sylvestris]
METPEPDRREDQSFPSSSSSSPSSSRVEEEESDRRSNGDNFDEQQRTRRSRTYHVNLLLYDVEASEVKDDIWSALAVLVTFWFFASMTMILGFYGSGNLQLGPNCSRLIQTNPFFVQSIKAQEHDEQKLGPVLYGFNKPPPLDVEIAWTETQHTLVPANFHKAWIYFLNKGSGLDITYRVKPTSSSPLTLVIAQGSESLAEWIEDPSYGNATLSWNIIYGSGRIQQEIPKSSTYYIAVGNLNPENVENSSEDTTEVQAEEGQSVQTPLLSPKDDDTLSWGSSYEFISNEEDLDECLAVSSLEGSLTNEGDSNTTGRLCVICFDGPRDCFFLPCGHCAACFTCGTRIAEEAGTCPICRRRMKKVRKIFTV